MKLLEICPPDFLKLATTPFLQKDASQNPAQVNSVLSVGFRSVIFHKLATNLTNDRKIFHVSIQRQYLASGAYACAGTAQASAPQSSQYWALAFQITKRFDGGGDAVIAFFEKARKR